MEFIKETYFVIIVSALYFTYMSFILDFYKVDTMKFVMRRTYLQLS